jgi:acetyltransferase-like isoleucine patch superfamily enzyme
MQLKDYILGAIKKNPNLHWMLSQIKLSPTGFIFSVLYAIYLTKAATGKFFPLRFIYRGKFIPVKINKSTGGQILIRDKIIIESGGQGSNPISLSIGRGAQLIFDGEFVIGPGCVISVASGALVKFQGRLESTGSGMTADTRIMAAKSIIVGHDCIIAWGCSISDSNWHELSGSQKCSPVVIGNHVWIGHDVTVLPGADLGNGCVIGAKSLVLGRKYQPLSLLAGNPARVIRENVTWSR